MKYTMNEIVSAFMEAKPKKTVFGNFRIEGDALMYRAQSSDEVRYDSKPADVKERMQRRTNAKLIDNEGVKRDIKDFKLKDGSYRCETGLHDVWLHRCRIQYTESNTVARKLADGTLLGNGSILDLIGRTVSYGNESRNKRETEIQRVMRASGFIMIPFSVFTQAGLDVMTFKRIEQGKEETLIINEPNPRYNSWDKKSKVKQFIPRPRHFVGASLFDVGGSCFLFDVDRREVKHKIFNPFLVKLAKRVKTISEAYETLKPKAVVEALKAKKQVQRQGEWFFIPVKTPKVQTLTPEQRIQILAREARYSFDKRMLAALRGGAQWSDSKLDKLRETQPNRLTLQAGPNRPNNAFGMTVKGATYVTGEVTHSGREHAPLKLKGWYVAVPNTSISSFTITGDVD